MKSVAHTPGPWEAHKIMPNCKLRAPEPESYVTAGPIDWPGNRVVAAVHSVDGTHSIADARLIAAAPDLLAALDRIANGQWPQSIGETEGTLAMRAVARAAIAKAGGAAAHDAPQSTAAGTAQRSTEDARTPHGQS